MNWNLHVSLNFNKIHLHYIQFPINYVNLLLNKLNVILNLFGLMNAYANGFKHMFYYHKIVFSGSL
jgi:hypothetical protein